MVTVKSGLKGHPLIHTLRISVMCVCVFQNTLLLNLGYYQICCIDHKYADDTKPMWIIIMIGWKKVSYNKNYLLFISNY